MVIFVNVQKMAKEYPATFEAPTASELKGIGEGTSVKVCANEIERFWVKITRRDGNILTGVVDNDLVCTDELGLKLGDTIAFGTECVYSVISFS